MGDQGQIGLGKSAGCGKIILEVIVLGIESLLEILAGAGVRYIFGNPGSTELPLNEALVGDSRFQYILHPRYLYRRQQRAIQDSQS